MAYADKTLRDANPVKRYLQNSRFEDALALIAAYARPGRLVDFGGGDGELCLRLESRYADAALVCYEPAPGMFAEAQEKLAGHTRVQLTNTLKDIEPGSCDVVVSLEVFEHLPEKELADALAMIAELLSDKGVFVVGIPNELHVAALYKGVFRMVRRFGSYDAQPTNIVRSVLGRPPADRPARKVAADKMYHFEHMGFDYRALATTLQLKFDCVAVVSSPFRWLPKLLSPEIYFVLRKPLA